MRSVLGVVVLVEGFEQLGTKHFLQPVDNVAV
jgi:hypothetical protein